MNKGGNAEMPANDDELMTLAEMAVALDRTVWTTRRYVRLEGLVTSYHRTRVVATRRDFNEWRNRPEVKAMLAAGDHMKAKGRSDRCVARSA
jgi:hypothetical protein